MLNRAKSLVAELTPLNAQSAWGFRGEGFELWDQQHVVIISQKNMLNRQSKKKSNSNNL